VTNPQTLAKAGSKQPQKHHKPEWLDCYRINP
ncbi:uncharacterized protein METZ01_LOCUS509094, partial [marine metagenome]